MLFTPHSLRKLTLRTTCGLLFASLQASLEEASPRQTNFCRKLQDRCGPLPAASIGLGTFLPTLGVAECTCDASWASLDPLGRSPGAPPLLAEPHPHTPRRSAALEVWWGEHRDQWRWLEVLCRPGARDQLTSPHSITRTHCLHLETSWWWWGPQSLCLLKASFHLGLEVTSGHGVAGEGYSCFLKMILMCLSSRSWRLQARSLMPWARTPQGGTSQVHFKHKSRGVHFEV